MTSVTFDTLGTARHLEAAGLDRAHAEAIATAIGRVDDRAARCESRPRSARIPDACTPGYATRAPFSTGNVGSSSTTPWVSDTAPRTSTSDFTPAIRFGGKFATATICFPASVSRV